MYDGLDQELRALNVVGVKDGYVRLANGESIPIGKLMGVKSGSASRCTAGEVVRVAKEEARRAGYSVK